MKGRWCIENEERIYNIIPEDIFQNKLKHRIYTANLSEFILNQKI